MQVILREDVPNVGQIGEQVSVKPGFARNFLLPRGLAVLADERQVRRVEHERQVIESRLAKQRRGAEDEKTRLEKVSLTISKAAGENEKLFGSVTAMEIESLLREEGFAINRRNIQLDEHIKTTGVFEVPIKLHRDVVATIKVYVVAKT